MTPDRKERLDRFYGLLAELRRRQGARTLADCHGRMAWPSRGVYFFFEDGELRADREEPRVVRVGTHALRPSASTLWGRLRQHRGTSTGGNHRGSIFRLHVGTALFASGAFSSPPTSWGRGAHADREVRAAEAAAERAVSNRIGAMPFVWLEVDDAPSAESERGLIERGAISLLSNYRRPEIDPPSPRWLGFSAARAEVRESGLWNVNHVKDPADGSFLDIMERQLASA